MNPEQFVFWLRGVADVVDGMPSLILWKKIKGELEDVEVEECECEEDDVEPEEEASE